MAGRDAAATPFIRIARGVMLNVGDRRRHRRRTGSAGIIIVVSILAISRYRISLDGAAKPAA